MQKWRSNIGKRAIRILLLMRSIRSLNLNDFSYNKQVDGQIKLREINSACMEVWNWEIGTSKKIMQEVAKKLKNWEEFVVKKQFEQDKQEKMNLSLHQERNPTTVGQLLTQIQELQDKINFLSDAREFYDLAAALERPTFSVNPLLFWVPELCLAATLDCRVIPGFSRVFQETFFERPLAPEGRSSTFFNNSKNLASSSQELRPDISGTTRRQESEMKREPLNTSILSPHFQRGGGSLNHTCGTYSHSVVIDYPSFPISDRHLGKFHGSLEFQCWKVNLKTEVCPKTTYLHLPMHWIKEVELAKSIDELVTSRSIMDRTDFTDYDMLHAMIASALKKLLNTQIHFR